MSGPVRPPLKTQLDNGTSSNRPVSTLAFANTDFTLTNSGTKTTIGIAGGAGGSIGGTIADTQVAFGSGADTITGTANFTFDGDRTLKFQGVTPRFYLGDTDVSTNENEMLLIMKSGSNSFVYDRDNAASLNLGAGDSPNHLIIRPDGEIIINELGNAEADVRIESDTQTNMLFVDAGENRVGVGTGTPSTIFHVSGDDHPSIRVTGTDNAGADPAIELLGTADDFTEGLQIWYDNGSGESYISTLINNDIGDLHFSTKCASDRNTVNRRMTIQGNGKVGIGTTVPDTSLHVFDNNSEATVVRIESNDTDTSSSPILELRNSRPYEVGITTASIGLIKFSADTVDGIEIVGSIALAQDSVTSFDSTSMQFKVKRSGVEVDNFRIRYSEVVVNEDSTDCDFRVETNGNTHGFHVDAATDIVGVAAIGVAGLADNNPKLQVNGSISGKVPIVVESSTSLVLTTSAEMSGQLYVFTSTSAKTLTLPTTCTQGDNLRFVATGAGGLDVILASTSTLNGVTLYPITIGRDTLNEIYEIVAISDNKYILNNPV